MAINRRGALALLGLGGGAAAAGSARARSRSAPRFDHGVASGDPLADRVILWTRLETGEGAVEAVPVTWEVFADAGLKQRVKGGAASAMPGRDFTVKVDVTGLKAGRDYWYRFAVKSAPDQVSFSPVGRTRTLPVGKTSDTVLAVATCSLYPGGYFNAYQAIADLPRVDAVLHLGDYIYEYGADGYGANIGSKIGRLPTPEHECVTLADYRERHACHKRDLQLQAAHARAPWIVVWDDHESANDTWMHGAENHQPATEGDWNVRKAAALKAYYEWMPIREPGPLGPDACYRSFQFGDLATVIMTETRLTGRDQQLTWKKDLLLADGSTDIANFTTRWTDPSRRMMGAPQEAWIAGELAASARAGSAWQVIGNQVVMARVGAPDFRAMMGEEKWAKVPPMERARAERLSMLAGLGLPYNLDSWDGYPADRARLYGLLREAGANPIVLSGDSHAFWANELYDEDGTLLAAEFGATGITSPGAGDGGTTIPIDAGFEANKEVVFNDNAAKGFVLLTLTRESAKGEMMAVSTILEKTFTTRTLKAYAVTPVKGGGVSRLKEV